jgi:hypothetical protein
MSRWSVLQIDIRNGPPLPLHAHDHGRAQPRLRPRRRWPGSYLPSRPRLQPLQRRRVIESLRILRCREPVGVVADNHVLRNAVWLAILSVSKSTYMPLLRPYNSPPRDEEYYREQWRSYYAERKRRVARLGLLVAGTCTLALLFAFVPEAFLEHRPMVSNIAAVIGGLLWLAIVIHWFTLNWTMGAWTCPRCGEPFFTSTFVRNPFGNRCRHCNLQRLKKSELREESLT